MTALESSNLLAKRTLRRHLSKAVLFPSWPLDQREYVQEISTFVHPREKAIIIAMKTPLGDYWYGNTIKRSKENVQVYYNKEMIYIKPISDT